MKKHSKILNQNIEFDEVNQTVTTNDGCFYNKSELGIIKNISDDMKRKVHLVKKYFQGEVV